MSPGGHQPPLQRGGAGCALLLPPLRRTGTPSPPPAISGALQPPRPKVCRVLEVVFVLAGVWFYLCSLLLPFPLLGGWEGVGAWGALLGFELEVCVVCVSIGLGAQD